MESGLVAVRGSFFAGRAAFIAADSPCEAFTCFFEDDGETGYFYAADSQRRAVLDAVHIYNAEAVVDRERECTAAIVWSFDGLVAALFINDYPHAVFDFRVKRGYCRNNFPSPASGWGATHAWDDRALGELSFNPAAPDPA